LAVRTTVPRAAVSARAAFDDAGEERATGDREPELRPDVAAPRGGGTTAAVRPPPQRAGAALTVRSRGRPGGEVGGGLRSTFSAARKLRAPGPRVPPDLLLGGDQRTLRQRVQLRRIPEEPLDLAVLQRVVRSTTTRPPGARTLAAQGREVVSSSISRLTAIPQRLERAAGGMRPARPPSQGPGDDAGELAGRLDAAARAGPNDGPRHAPRLPFLAEPEDQVGELLLGEVVHEVRGGRSAGGGVHPHVERPVDAVAEPALPPVELHRRDAKVVQHAVGGRDGALRRLAEHPGHGFEIVRRTAPAARRPCERRGVPVHATTRPTPASSSASACPPAPTVMSTTVRADPRYSRPPPP